MEQDWLTYAKRLQAIAATGLAYGKDKYDIERFQEVQAIAQEMLSKLYSLPIERISELSPDARAHPTPRIDVRGAVIENGQILLVREEASGLWTLPGGFAEIGLSAAENVVKEISEEASLSVVAKQLYSVRHKAKGPFRPDVRDFYKFYFLCDIVDGGSPMAGPDVLEAAFFSRNRIPELCPDRTVNEDIERAFEARANPGMATIFD